MTEKVPELMKNPEKLSIDLEGRMRARGVLISNERLLRYFYAKMVWNEALSKWIIQDGNKAVEVDVADTALVVKSIEREELILSDFSREQFLPETLMNDFEGSSAFYCKVKSGRYLAKLLSSAAQGLFSEIEEKDKQFFYRGYQISRLSRENCIS